MKQHYNLNDVEWNKLSRVVTTMELISAIPEFDRNDSGEQISKISLMLYIDHRGDFSEGNSIHKKIARAVFGSLDSSDQVEIIKYLQWHEEGEGNG